MKLYNKGARSIIVSKDDVVSGGRFAKNDLDKKALYHDADKEVEYTEEAGNRLKGMYPKELMHVDKGTERTKKKVVAKKKTKAKAKAKR